MPENSHPDVLELIREHLQMRQRLAHIVEVAGQPRKKLKRDDLERMLDLVLEEALKIEAAA